MLDLNRSLSSNAHLCILLFVGYFQVVITLPKEPNTIVKTKTLLPYHLRGCTIMFANLLSNTYTVP